MIRRFIPYLEINGSELILDETKPYKQTDAVELARFYESAGADELMLIERSRFKDRSEKLISLVEKMSQELFLPITVSGGIDSVSKIRQFLRAGCVKTCLSSPILKHPEFLHEASENVGKEHLSLLIVYRKNDAGVYEIFSKTGKPCFADIFELIEFAKDHVSEIYVKPSLTNAPTDDIDIDLARKLADSVETPVIFGLEVNSTDKNMFNNLFSGSKVAGILSASVFHNPQLSITKIKRTLKNFSISVRLSNDCLKRYTTKRTGQISINLLESNPHEDSEIMNRLNDAQQNEK